MPSRAMFDAGSPALTLANMAGSAGGEAANPEKTAAAGLAGAGDYPGLVEAFRRMGLIDDGRAGQLLEQARAAPFRASEVLAEARILARVMQRIFAALAGNLAPLAADIAFLNGSLGGALAHLSLAAVSLAPAASSPAVSGSGPRFGWAWRGDGGGQPGAILWPLLRDAAELLVTEDPARIRRCQGAGCERLFLDTSKAGRRRWCRMQTCGNRAKARRHARRHAPESGSGSGS